jgi:hypothetical protein
MKYWRWAGRTGFPQRFTGTFADGGGTIVGRSQNILAEHDPVQRARAAAETSPCIHPPSSAKNSLHHGGSDTASTNARHR